MPNTAIKIQNNSDHMQLFEQLCNIINSYNVNWLSEESGVSSQAIYFWLSGKTRKPRLDTIFKVARAVGWNLTLIKERAVLHAVK